MEADQADSPGDSIPLPEISRFIENLGLHFESCDRPHRQSTARGPLTPDHIAETRKVHRKRASAYLVLRHTTRPEDSANLPGMPGDSLLSAARTRPILPLPRIPGMNSQPLTRDHHNEEVSSFGSGPFIRPQVRITV